MGDEIYEGRTIIFPKVHRLFSKKNRPVSLEKRGAAVDGGAAVDDAVYIWPQAWETCARKESKLAPGPRRACR